MSDDARAALAAWDEDGSWDATVYGDDRKAVAVAEALRALLASTEAQPPTEFCDQCAGPYGGWLQKYGGHWDTCPNRTEAQPLTEPTVRAAAHELRLRLLRDLGRDEEATALEAAAHRTQEGHDDE